MTSEHTVAIVLPLDEERRRLVDDIHSAASRAAGAEPGDRLDIVRFETLASQIEGWAFRQIGKDGVAHFTLAADTNPRAALVSGAEQLPEFVPPSEREAVQQTLSAGGVMVIVRLPLEPGTTSAVFAPVSAPPPAARWQAPENVYGARAVRARFEDQLLRAVGTIGDTIEPINPSGIQNRVLTEALRTFVTSTTDGDRIDVPVEYRDGSRASHPFPLRCLELVDAVEAGETLAFSLLSIRHTELDAIVDGAWLRNNQISQTRTQAETDDLVYDISGKQLRALTDYGRSTVVIKMYQTGLEPAIVGFYRAVTNHLLRYPGTLAVVPMYFQQPRQKQQEPEPKRGKQAKPPRKRPDRKEPEQEQRETYGLGLPWATSGGSAR